MAIGALEASENPGAHKKSNPGNSQRVQCHSGLRFFPEIPQTDYVKLEKNAFLKIIGPKFFGDNGPIFPKNSEFVSPRK